MQPSLVSSLLAEAGSLQVLPGCLEDRERGILLTPPSLRILVRERNGDDDDEGLAVELQSLTLEQESVLASTALLVAGSEVKLSAGNGVTRSEGKQHKVHEEIQHGTEAWQSEVHGDKDRQSRAEAKDQICQADLKVQGSGSEQCREDIEVQKLKPLDLEVARLASVEVVGGDPRYFHLRMADSNYRPRVARSRLDQALKQVSSMLVLTDCSERMHYSLSLTTFHSHK